MSALWVDELRGLRMLIGREHVLWWTEGDEGGTK